MNRFPKIVRGKRIWISSFLFCAFILAGSFTAGSGLEAENEGLGHRLLVYYGTPEGVNDLWDPAKAAEIFRGYDYVVFGDGLEFPEETHHQSTASVMALMLQYKPDMKIFGYIDLGVSTDNLSMMEIKRRVDLWDNMGVGGIFLDDAGYDYKVSRQRLNEALDYVHRKRLLAFINAWHPEQVMGSAKHPVYNPKGTPSLIGRNDYYLFEDFLRTVDITDPQEPSVFTGEFRNKMDQALRFRKLLGVKLLSISIIDYDLYSANAVRKFFRMNEATAAVFSLDGYGLAPDGYSAHDNNSDIVRKFPYIRNYAKYRAQDVQYVAKYRNQDYASPYFRVHSVPGQHYYNYPSDVEY